MGASEDKGNGVLFNNYDSGGLWWGLQQTVKNHRFFRMNQNEWEKQAKRIMKEAKHRWDLNKMLTGYLSAYEKILGHPLI